MPSSSVVADGLDLAQRGLVAGQLLAEALGLGLLGRAVAPGASGLADALADARALGAGGLDRGAQGARPLVGGQQLVHDAGGAAARQVGRHALGLGADHLEVEH